MSAETLPNSPPVIIATAGRPRRRWVWLGSAAVIGGLIVYFVFNPSDSALFPSCHFYQLTGILCPGCGGQRALHFLLHGELRQALRDNALFVLSLPFGGWFAFRLGQFWLIGRNLPAVFNHRFAPWIIFSLVLGFGLVRNLPGFSWLRP